MTVDAATPRTKYYTPREIAVELGVSVDKILAFIHTGILIAVDVSSAGSTRPRFMISPHNYARFLNARAAKPLPKVPRKRQEKEEAGFVKYF